MSVASSSTLAPQDSRARILEAAATAFGQNGYKGASMSRIARDAEVSKSLLHYHFDCKENLFVELQLTLLRGLLTRIRSVADGPATLAQFERAMERVMEFLEEETDELRVLLEFYNMGQSSPTVARRLVAFDAEVDALIVEGLQNVLGPLMDRLVVPPDRMARLLHTVFNGLILELCWAVDAEVARRTRQTFEDARTLITRALLQEND